MKRTLIILFALASLTVNAQEMPRVESNHSISANIWGLAYAYEQALGWQFSIIGRIGFEPMITYSWIDDYLEETHIEYHSRPAISLETRCYTSIIDRALLGRNIMKNSSDFVSLKATAADYLREGDTYFFKFTASYGIRRVYNHFFIEPTAGMSFFTWDNKTFPDLQFRFGFVF